MMWLELLGAVIVATALAIGAVHIMRYLVRRERRHESFPLHDLRSYLADMEDRYQPDYEAAKKRFDDLYKQTQKEKGVSNADHETK